MEFSNEESREAAGPRGPGGGARGEGEKTLLSQTQIFSSTCLIGVFDWGESLALLVLGGRQEGHGPSRDPPAASPLRLLARIHSCCWLLASQTTSHPPSLLTIVGYWSRRPTFGFNFGLCKR